MMPSDLEILEEIDPDWRDHFPYVELAADHYRRYAPDEWRAAMLKLTCEDDRP
jgi:hypothetical protein